MLGKRFATLLATLKFALWCVLQRSPTVTQLRESLKKRDAISTKEEEEQEAPCSYLTDTYCYLLGYTNPYIYDQSELTTTERRINQVYMLQVGLGLIQKTKLKSLHKEMQPLKYGQKNDYFLSSV